MNRTTPTNRFFRSASADFGQISVPVFSVTERTHGQGADREPLRTLIASTALPQQCPFLREAPMNRIRLLPSPASAPESTRVTACRSCGAADLREFLSLGSTPVANALVDAGSAHLPDPEYPLSVAFCPRCSLVPRRSR